MGIADAYQCNVIKGIRRSHHRVRRIGRVPNRMVVFCAQYTEPCSPQTHAWSDKTVGPGYTIPTKLPLFNNSSEERERLGGQRLHELPGFCSLRHAPGGHQTCCLVNAIESTNRADHEVQWFMQCVPARNANYTIGYIVLCLYIEQVS